MNYLWKVGSLAAIVLSRSALTLAADVKMPAIFGDHMVLQQGITLRVWGTAEAGEKVTVTVEAVSASVTASADGKWMAKLAPLPAGTTPVTMTVTGKNRLILSDVLVGDVWVCSGQSNMQFGLGNAHNATEEVPKANLPLLRLFFVPGKTSLTPLADIPVPSNSLQGRWVVCTPDNVMKVGNWNGFSAVGYFFGREIQKSTGRPVGLIGTYWGGTPAQAWTSAQKLRSDPALKGYANALAKTQANYAQALASFPADQAAYQTDLAKWKQNEGLPPNARVTPADNDKAKAAGRPTAPRPPSPPDGGPSTPSILYNCMIAPLIPYAIKGVIWYQGEANAGQGFQYRTLFADMITDWREHWGEGNFPFLFVQLAKYNEPNIGFAQLRESQLKVLALPQTGMAVAFDVGNQNNIHPADKLDVGLRLALAAKHIAYGQDVIYSGPIFDKIHIEGHAIRVFFTQIGSGLIIGTAPWTPAGAAPLPNTSLTGFTVSGPDNNWVPADAEIEGNDVVVSSSQLAQPVAVRYAFPDAVGNLYNKEGLPASPFRSDHWQVTAPKPTAPAASTSAPPAANKYQGPLDTQPGLLKYPSPSQGGEIP